jgi:hypothetical protein
MAEWASVERYIKSEYVVAHQEGKWINLDFDMGNGRSQMMTVTHVGPFIQFVSPFGHLSEVDIREVFLLMREEGIVLGITCVDDMLVVTHSQLLHTVDEEEVDAGIQIVVQAAETLERRLSFQDRF